MLRLISFLLFFHQSLSYGVKVQGKVDIGNALATIISDMAGQYLQTDKTGRTDINFGKLLDDFQNMGGAQVETKPNSDNDERRDDERRDDERRNEESNEDNQKAAATEAEEIITENRETNDRASEEKRPREKTMLEELIGMQESIHVYGNHKRNHFKNFPINNIKA